MSRILALRIEILKVRGAAAHNQFGQRHIGTHELFSLNELSLMPPKITLDIYLYNSELNGPKDV